MSMLSSQADELRDKADILDGLEGMDNLVADLREAADTIEGLRKQVAKCQIAELKADYDTSRYFELFGTPEKAARTLANVCQFTHGGELCDRCQAYLFDSCDRTLRLGSEQKIYDALLEWLRGDA